MLPGYVYNSLIVPFFVPDSQPLVLPAGSVMKYDGGKWGLYQCPPLVVSFLVTRARQDGVLGWRIRHIPYLANVSFATDYVRQTCGSCIDEMPNGDLRRL